MALLTLNQLKRSETQIPGGARSSQKSELRRHAIVNKSIILKTYYFTPACLPLLRGPLIF